MTQSSSGIQTSCQYHCLVSFSDELFISHIYDLHILLFILFIDIQHSDAGLAEMLSQFATGVTAVM